MAPHRRFGKSWRISAPATSGKAARSTSREAADSRSTKRDGQTCTTRPRSWPAKSKFLSGKIPERRQRPLRLGRRTIPDRLRAWKPQPLLSAFRRMVTCQTSPLVVPRPNFQSCTPCSESGRRRRRCGGYAGRAHRADARHARCSHTPIFRFGRREAWPGTRTLVFVQPGLAGNPLPRSGLVSDQVTREHRDQHRRGAGEAALEARQPPTLGRWPGRRGWRS